MSRGKIAIVTGSSRGIGRAMRWKPALNAFAITFNGRITPTGN
jgi:NAD(P)-dependent dehydrogenase (short-subunit alcohol dehydrogenase family)